MIIDINIEYPLTNSLSGSIYRILGNAKRSKIKIEEYELLSQGFNRGKLYQSDSQQN
jgi:hypothetical protein